MSTTAAHHAEPKVARFVNGAPTVIRLDDPVEFEGQVYDEVRVTRITVGAYRDHVDGGGRTEILALPMFFSAGGHVMPQAVMNGLSLPDGQRVTEAAASFLNHGPKDEAQRSPSASADGAP